MGLIIYLLFNLKKKSSTAANILLDENGVSVEFEHTANLFVLVTARSPMWLAVHSGQKGLLFFCYPYLSLSIAYCI
jgi:hypothetical protein